jgi:hypothetical protein
MKRFPFALGLFLVLLPFSAQALTPLCTQVLGDTTQTPPTPGIPVVSPYVQKVLDRSNAGITYAASLGTGEGPFTGLPSAAQNLRSFFSLLVDVQLTLNEQALDLPQNSACLHADILKIQCQMDKVHDELFLAFTASSPARINQLQAQLPFLRDRLKYLLRGAADPSFADPEWGAKNTIDPPTGSYWCCAPTGGTCTQDNSCAGQQFYTLEGCMRGSKCAAPVAQSPEDARMCPFSSDYGPAMKNGYGCDASVMEPRSVYGTMIYEKDTLAYLVNRLNEVTVSLGGTPSLPVSHKPVLNGCMRKYGYCSDDKTFACAENVDCVEANLGQCMFDVPPDAAWSAVRSPFTLLKDQLGILARFVGLREQQGFSRQQADELKVPSEFSSQRSSESAVRAASALLEGGFRSGFRTDFSNWSKQQGRDEANAFAQSTDTQQSMVAALPMSGVGGQLKNLVKDMDGVRGFLVQYAYFARRTCVNRPCSQKLEQILRMAYTNSCFPFADGSYKNDSLTDPQWQKCAKDACIPVDGVTLDAGKCVCYKINAGTNLANNPTEVAPTDNPDVCVPR